jgi:GNAT superfamily N-acetyltransferase
MPETLDLSTTISVAELPAEAVHTSGRLLSRAFAADPILTYFLSGPLRRQIAYPAFFRELILEHLESRHVYGAWDGDRLVGVVVWAPPHGAPPSFAMRLRARLDHLVVRLLFPRRASKLYRGFAATASLHPHDPHWYLFFVGVDPSYQGRGVGKQLLAPVLQTADRDRALCYLETPFPATHEFYRRLGFELRPATHPFEGAPPLWSMIRRPETGATTSVAVEEPHRP